MPFHQYGQTVKFPRNEHVEVHVRVVTLNADAPESERRDYVEIREFIRNGEVYGHGIVLPVNQVADLKIALDRVVPRQDSNQ